MAIMADPHVENQDSLRKQTHEGGFFMTETDNFGERDRSPEQQASPPKQSMLP